MSTELIERLRSCSTSYEPGRAILLMREAADALSAQAARIAGLERDAARYRRIRLGQSDLHGDVYAMIFAPDGDYPEDGDELDAAIDAAIAAQAGSKEGSR